MPASATDRELKRLRKRIWEYQLQDQRDKLKWEIYVLQVESDVQEAHRKIESLTEATRKLAAIIEHRLGEKSPPPVLTEEQKEYQDKEDTKRDELFLESDLRGKKIRSLKKKLEGVKADYNLESADKEIIDVEEPVEEFVREVFRDANRSRRPKRKRYTPQRCMKKEE